VSLFGPRGEATDPAPQDEDFLLKRPAPAWSEFAGAEIIDKGAILRWRTEYGTVGLVHSVPFAHHSARRFVSALSEKHGRDLPRFYASIVSAELTMGWYGPDLEAVDIQRGGKVSDRYQPICEEVARITGTAVPIWPSRLRDLETIKTWKPGAAPAIVPAFDSDVPTEPFTTLAAEEPDDSLVALVCLWLARTIRDRATEDAESYIEMLKDVSKDYGDKWFTFGAVPEEMQGPQAEPPREEIRREAWWQILNRRDSLAAKVARLGEMLDGGKDWPTGGLAKVYPQRRSTAAAWAARLAPSTNKKPTVLEQHLLASVDAEDHRGRLLVDPRTGLPAIHCENHSEGKYIATQIPYRLPTTAPMTSVILSDEIVWIATEDHGLWLAPECPGVGLNWGYGGSGPYALALLLDRLLDDITAQPICDYQSRPPAGLHRLIEHTPQDGSTTYKRKQLEQARKSG
jgi:hypothetical protein